MKLFPFMLALLLTAMIALILISLRVNAQGLPAFCPSPNAVTEATGLGNGGFACSGAVLRSTSPGARIWVITGSNPDPVITITIDNSPILNMNPAGGNRRAQCIAMPAWTMPEYAEGYPIPEWPVVFVDQSAYDVNAKTATVRLRTLDPLNTLQPNSNYSLNVQCLTRLY